MKAIVLNNINYCKYPEGIENIEQFVDYCNKHYNSFIKLIKYSEENCCSPYFIENEFEEIYLNISSIHRIHEEEITILSKAEYDTRLRKVVAEKCIYCVNYESEASEDDLKGHRGNISLDGECFYFEKKSE